MVTSALKTAAAKTIKEQIQNRERGVTIARSDKPKMVKIWLPYQKRWINDKSFFCLGEKSRQVGLTEAEAYRAVDDCIHDRLDTYYSTYNLPNSKPFIRKCARWARGINKAYFLRTGRQLLNESSIGVYRIEFLNGRFIEAISSESKNTRGLERAILVKDEAAFDEHLEETLEAMKAIRIRGVGRMRLISTHWGTKTEFYKQIQILKEKPHLGSLHKITFMDAIAQGLYKNICEVKGEIWTPEKERQYIKDVYEQYGIAASQELDVIPRAYSSNDIFRPEYFRKIRLDEHTLATALKVRYFDIASSTKKNSFYSATLMISIVDNLAVITDIQAEKLEAAAGDDWMESIILRDDSGTVELIEIEPGSSGQKYFEYFRRRLDTAYIEGYTPTKNKVTRALPLVPALKRQDLVILDREYYIDGRIYTTDQVIELFCRFTPDPEPLVTDIVDCASGSFEYSLDRFSDWIGE